MDELDSAAAPIASLDPRDYRYVMSLARRYNAIVFWHRDRNGVDWQPVLLPLGKRRRARKRRR